MWEVFLFAARSTSTALNSTHFPSGEGTGAPTRFSFIMSSKVKGRFCDGVCASTEAATKRNAARKLFMNGTASVELPEAQAAIWGAHASGVLGDRILQSRTFP